MKSAKSGKEVRYFFKTSYKGTAYHGWQRQKNAISVQQVIEEKLSTVVRHPVEIVGSGRTDTGVHAREQYFHVDLANKDINTELLREKMNSFLPEDIGIQAITLVREDAHARFDAISRSYEYLIISQKDPFRTDYAYRYSKDLDFEAMNTAATKLIGDKDFACFSRVKTDVNNFRCIVSEAHWTNENDLCKFKIRANRFLRGMVRAIVGTLLDVGTGKVSQDEFKAIVDSKDRKRAGRAVPAKGLYLTRIVYPKSIS